MNDQFKVEISNFKDHNRNDHNFTLSFFAGNNLFKAKGAAPPAIAVMSGIKKAIQSPFISL